MYKEAFFRKLSLRKPLASWLSLLIVLVVHGFDTCANHPAAAKPHVVFLISEDSLNYEAHKTIPIFADQLRKTGKYEVTVLLGNGSNNAFRFPGLEVIQKADVLVLFSRRISLPHNQMQLFKNYLAKGGPLVAIRTGNHAFTSRGEKVAGYEDWPGFVAEILGCGNFGYGPVELGTDVSVAPQAAGHRILKDFKPAQFHSTGNLYRVAPLVDAQAVVLLNGRAGQETQPVAWTRQAGKSKIFYTTLGHPADFSVEQFKGLLINAIQWATIKKP
jgi:hypothetical protein